MTRVLVTGATGFIGYHLVKKLSEKGVDVSCLVRPTSYRSRIEPFRPRIVSGDVTDIDSLRRAVDGVDIVYHLAGVTKSFSAKSFDHVNASRSARLAQTARWYVDQGWLNSTTVVAKRTEREQRSSSLYEESIPNSG